MRAPVAIGHPHLVRLVAGLVLLAVLTSCGDDDGDESSPPCDGMVDEDLLADVLGTEIERPVGAIEPRHMNSRCDVRSRDDPDETYLNIDASYPPSAELADQRRNWPETAADVEGAQTPGGWCRDPWVATGDGEYGSACVEHEQAAGGDVTHLTSLWGDLEVSVQLTRPHARPSDPEDAYRIAANVAEHLNAS